MAPSSGLIREGAFLFWNVRLLNKKKVKFIERRCKE